MINKIIEYENRLDCMKQELNNLIIESNQAGNDKALINYKINAMRRQISDMNNELSILSNQLNSQQYNWNGNPQGMRSREAGNPVRDAKPQIQGTLVPQNQQYGNQSNNYYNNNVNIQNKANTKPQTHYNYENVIGRVIMGILASVLIFVGLVTFATLVLPLLGDGIKVALMFIISGLILFLGLKLFNKDEKNRLGISLTGCGFGAIYISLFVTTIVFNMLNPYILYVCIIIWSLALLKISQKNKYMLIISQIGIIISILLGLNGDFCSPLIICIYSILIEDVFMAYHAVKYKEVNIVNTISLILTTMSYTMVSCNSLDTKIGAFLLVANYTLYLILFLIKIKVKDKNISLFFASCFTYLAIYACVMFDFTYKIELFTVIFLTLTILIEKVIKEEDDNFKTIDIKRMCILAFNLITVLFVLGLNATTTFKFDMNSTFMDYIFDKQFGAFLSLGFVYYGFKHKKYEYQIPALILMLLSMPLNLDAKLADSFITLMPTALMIYLIIKEKYCKSILQVISYVFSIFGVAMAFGWISSLIEAANFGTMQSTTIIRSDYWITLVFYIVLFIANTYIYSSKYKNNWATNEKSEFFEMSLVIINGIIMLMSLSFIGNSYNVISVILSILLAVGAFSLTAKKLMNYDKNLIQACVPIKYCILLYTILINFNANQIIISIMLLIAAVISIIIGFKTYHKAFRIYGLALSIISILKLLFIDIEYNSPIERIIGLFIGGLLCFGISYIYNSIDNKLKNNK